MALVLCGLFLALALYLAAIYGILWSAGRRRIGADAMPAEPLRFPSYWEILTRHSLEWLLGFFAFFLLLGIADFPLWQRLGLGAVFALVFGWAWFDQSGRNRDDDAAPRHKAASNLWYWFLAFVDWLGFMWLLCFSSALVLEAVA